MKDNKTNVMRILDKEKIPYEPHFYEPDGQVDGMHTAQILGIPFERCFKTLVTYFKKSDGKTEHYVFCIPVNAELDLKAAARAAGVKSVEMLAVKDFLNTTGLLFQYRNKKADIEEIMLKMYDYIDLLTVK